MRRRELPPGWAAAPLAIDETGALVALVRSAGPGEDAQVSARRLPPDTAAQAHVALGEPFECALAHARAGHGRWLFGGTCRDQGGQPWLMGQDGARVILAARALADVADRLERVAAVQVLAVDPELPRMALCSTIALRGQETPGTREHVELVAQAGEAVVRRPVGRPGATCAAVAFARTGRVVTIADGAQVALDLPPSLTDWSPRALAARSTTAPQRLVPRFAAAKPLGHWLTFADPDHLVATAADGTLTVLPAEPAPPTPPRALGSRLGRVPAPWAAWQFEAPDGVEFDDRVAVHPEARWLVDHHLGAARVWPGSARAASASLAAGVAEVSPAADALAALEARLPPSRHPDPPVRFVSVARRPFRTDPLSLFANHPAPTSADGLREVVWADGLAYLNTRPPPAPDRSTPPAWSIELPERAMPLRLDESYRFVSGGRWLLWVHPLGRAAAAWPATIGAAGDLLAVGRRGCMPPHSYSIYQGLALDEAEATWAECEAERRPVDGP